MMGPVAPGPALAEAQQLTRRMARSHYENFLLVSWLLPRRLHQHLFNLYAYCRHVDDLGDEAPGDRLALLDSWQAQVHGIFAGSPPADCHPIILAMGHTIAAFGLPQRPLLDLIEAPRRDQTVRRYQTADDLFDYCTYSADPVGRLVLLLFGYRDEARLRLSDATCTALQLANFWQGVSSDYHQRGRIYLPLEDLTRFGLSEQDVARGLVDDRWRALMRFEIERTRELFAAGAALPGLVDRRLRVDLRLFTLGGLAVLDAIEQADYDVFRRPPKVPGWRQAALFSRALVGALGRSAASPRGRP